MFARIFGIKELVDLLSWFNISVDKFGKGEAKSVQNFLDEIKEEDCQIVIVGKKLYRKVSVIRTKVLYANLILKEYLQILKDGTEAPRDRLHVSEKIHINELPVNALYRGLKEELGINTTIDYEVGDVIIEDSNLKTRYPGLPSVYTFHDFIVRLTDEQYKKDGYVEYEKRTGIITCFKWVDNPNAN